eukprot:GHUV01016538.1.p1 GENE.GHUV01016538.1~~GHUV01016538.1.p1  ORF type:complete len:339 (+),score=127.36 GHUV01016538.1:531-1547(+)
MCWYFPSWELISLDWAACDGSLAAVATWHCDCRSLGQNFCTDDNILSDIVTAARVTAADAVIEVGPGTGNLTRHLLVTNAQIIAVEKDDTLIERLREQFQQASNLQLHHGDVMQLDLQQLVQQAATATAAAGQQTPQQHPDALHSSSTSRTSSSGAGQSPSKRKVKVVANLPYNITKDFLLSLLPQGDVVSELSIMIQEEVAQRLVDPTPSRPDYRAMSVITHYYSKPVYRFRIPKEKYYPVPGVDGALVTFKLIPAAKRLPVATERGFISMVNKAFSERRKMLRNNLQPTYSTQQVEAALSKADIRTDVRAQDLTVEQFAEVYNNLQHLLVAQTSSG